MCGKDADGNDIDIGCELPGDNATALWRAGVIPDPYIERNEAKVQWIARVPWTFCTRFTLSEVCADEQYYLSFDSIDTCAKLYLNGIEMGASNIWSR